MIQLENISKSYSNQNVLENFSIKINDGDFISITGKSGSGKTTLLNIIALLEKPDSGKVLIDNKEIKAQKDILLYHRNKVGFLFQNFALIEEKTVIENLKIGVAYRKDIKSNFINEADKALNDVGLPIETKGKKVFQLSGGEQQRVALARIILKNPKYILADEPTGNLDIENRDIVFNCLKNLNGQGKTVILVTHDTQLSDKTKEKIVL